MSRGTERKISGAGARSLRSNGYVRPSSREEVRVNKVVNRTLFATGACRGVRTSAR